MKIYRIEISGTPTFAIEGDGFLIPTTSNSLATIATGGSEQRSERVSLNDAKLLAPLIPGKIVAVGRNYADHAKELGNSVPSEPILFMKPPSAIIGPEMAIVRPVSSDRVDFEGELGIVIGTKARNIQASGWKEFVLGFTCVNDVTARDLQKRDVQFTRGKSFDTFCPIGPCIATDVDPSDLKLVSRVNGDTRQDGRTSQMIFGPGALLEFITSIMTLEEGDLILTGTPAGVGPLTAGDRVEIEIEGIGTLRNPVQ
ncbi:MAG TPA: fumarylacetoacetate hydrolase family protein [Thermoanaerobaculia bacterium]|nr:fumarylacetoacetate hydrolase family protein [Thermoanaerobaculia bacterium]